MIAKLDITQRLNTVVDASMLKTGGFDEVVIATGVSPRVPDLPGIDNPKVVPYIDAI